MKRPRVRAVVLLAACAALSVASLTVVSGVFVKVPSGWIGSGVAYGLVGFGWADDIPDPYTEKLHLTFAWFPSAPAWLPVWFSGPQQVSLDVPTIPCAAIATIVILVLDQRRRLPGGCPKCGYDLAGLDQCPECGTAADDVSDQ